MSRNKPTTVGFAPALADEIKVLATRTGVPWTVMVSVLVREAIDARSQKKGGGI